MKVDLTKVTKIIIVDKNGNRIIGEIEKASTIKQSKELTLNITVK